MRVQCRWVCGMVAVFHAVTGFGVAAATQGPDPGRLGEEVVGAEWNAEAGASIERLEQRIIALESRGCDTGGRSSGWSGGAEALFLRPCATARSLPVQYLTDAGFQPAWRLWGGVSGEDGLGVGVRWWQFDNTNGPAGQPIRAEAVFQKLDVEANQRLGFRVCDVLLSGGVTYAANGIGGAGPGSFARWRFDGVGLTAGAQVIRPTPWLRGLTLAAAIQGSAVFGPSVMPGSIYGPAVYRQANNCATIFEASFGPRWERRLRGGAIAFAGGACESQYWSTGLGSQASSFFPTVGFWGGDVGLIGLTCNLGVRR